VSPSQIALLGAIAGLTIVLGLPIGRMNAVTPKVKAFLNGTAIGILVFLLWDVLTNAWQPADEAPTAHHYGSAVAMRPSCWAAPGPACSAWSTSTAGSPGGPAGRLPRGRVRHRPGRCPSRPFRSRPPPGPPSCPC